MGKKIAVDHEDVKAVFLATGSLAEAADAFDLKHSLVRQWAKRENWETPMRLIRTKSDAESKLADYRERVEGREGAASVSQALENHLERSAKSFRSSMATALSSAASAVSEMPPISALDMSRKLVDLATAGKTIFQLGEDGQGATLQLNVLHMSADQFLPATRDGAIDCHTTALP